MSVFNAENTGYKTGYQRLFLGVKQGLLDTINVQYPELEALYQQQMSQIWNEFEVDLSQDRMDMLETDKSVTDLMVKTISWQHLADSVAARSISGLLMPHVTNSEMENLINAWSLFETIHARTYSHIVKQTFADPGQMLEETYTNTAVLNRSQAIVGAFDKLEEDHRHSQVTDTSILLTLTALFALEEIGFMGSFAVTFGIAEHTGKFMGIAQLVKLICRDEVLHTRFNGAILKIHQRIPAIAEMLESPMLKSQIQKILDAVVAQEIVFQDYLFSEGRECIGINADLIKQYIYFMAAPMYEAYGLVPSFDVPKKNPLPYMDHWIDGSKVQVAPQELQNSAYQVGAVADDTHNLDLGNMETWEIWAGYE
ncbi:ribonucleoside triphosphate reductase beta chain [Aeromonas phage PVN04]|nr:ribonucleoside triphosphate reductase beta chain [Aeromonas phage PVN04]